MQGCRVLYARGHRGCMQGGTGKCRGTCCMCTMQGSWALHVIDNKRHAQSHTPAPAPAPAHTHTHTTPTTTAATIQHHAAPHVAFHARLYIWVPACPVCGSTLCASTCTPTHRSHHTHVSPGGPAAPPAPAPGPPPCPVPAPGPAPASTRGQTGSPAQCAASRTPAQGQVQVNGKPVGQCVLGILSKHKS
jgi:hypothetical protein